MGVKPVDGALDHVAPVGSGRDEAVAFIRVDDQLGIDALGLERVPELEGLRSRALAIAVADDDQRGRLDLLDVVDG